MSALIKLVIAVIGVVSLVSSIMFYLGLASGAIRIYFGDYNATQEMVQSLSDEVASTIEWTTIMAVLIAVASALGLTSIVAILKKL